MTDSISFFIPGPPVAAQRPRGRGKVFYTPPKYREGLKRGKGAAQWAMRGRAPHEGPVSVQANFYARRKPDARPDCDNYIKWLLDSMSGSVFKDDAQVVLIRGAKMRTDGDGHTWVEVEFL